MSPNRTLALALVLALSVGLAGCSGLTGGEGELTEAERLQQDAVDAMEDVDSYTFTLEILMDAESAQGDASIEIVADGAANRAQERLYMDVTMDIAAQGQSQSFSIEAYQVGETMYVEQFGTWQSQPAGAGAWDNYGAQQTELLENAEVSVVGTETVDGVETTVLEVEPDEDDLEELAQSGANPGAAGTGAASMSIESATVRQYVASEAPHYVLRTDVELEATVDGDAVSMEMTMTVDDLEEDVTVDLPEEIPAN